jgi:hypothetical protein
MIAETLTAQIKALAAQLVVTKDVDIAASKLVNVIW